VLPEAAPMENPHYGWGFPPDVSTYGAVIDHLIIVIHWFMLVLFVGWGIFFVYCLIRFRQRPGHKASYESAHTKFPKFLEVGIALFEAFLLIAVSYPVWSKLRYQLPEEKDSLVIRIVAQQFVWNIHYPGKDNVFGKTDPKLISDSNPLGLDMTDPASADDIVSVSQLHIPVNKPVIAKLSSKDVIHGFSIPVLRVKHDVIPGMVFPIWFQAKETGQFEIACAQLCGVGHTLMRGFVSIDTPEQYDAWMAEQVAQLIPPPAATPVTAPTTPAPAPATHE